MLIWSLIMENYTCALPISLEPMVSRKMSIGRTKNVEAARGVFLREEKSEHLI